MLKVRHFTGCLNDKEILLISLSLTRNGGGEDWEMGKEGTGRRTWQERKEEKLQPGSEINK